MIKALCTTVGLSAGALVLLCGCGESKELTLYLQDLELRGPVSRLPVHITRDPAEQEISIMPSFWAATGRASSGKIDGHSPVNSGGVFHVDTVRRTDNGVFFQDPGNVNSRTFDGKNLSWRYPSTGGGLDIDVGLSARWALSLGASYSVAGGKGLWGYRAGLGLRQHKGSLGLRLDVGWDWESFAYESVTLATDRELTSSVSTVANFRDVGVSTMGNLYAALTINGTDPEWALNPFLQIGISRQTMQDYKPTAPKQEGWIIPPYFLVPAQQLLIVHDLRGKFESTRVHLTPGMYLQVDTDLRLLVGARVSIKSGIEDLSDPLLVLPFVQMESIP